MNKQFHYTINNYKANKFCRANYTLRLRLDLLLWECILAIMHFAENSVFDKILKKNFKEVIILKGIVFGWYFRECIILIK